MYGITAFPSRSPCIQKAMLTAELMWAPEILPKIRIAIVTAMPNTAEMITAESVNAIEPHPRPTINAVPKNSDNIRFHTNRV